MIISIVLMHFLVYWNFNRNIHKL